MILATGNMWDSVGERDLVFTTTNGVIKNDGTLVMGAGHAKQVAERDPNTPIIFGSWITAIHNPDNHGVYKYHLVPAGENRFGAIQTKLHWRDKSDPTLLIESLDHFKQYALSLPSLKFHIPYPGIGFGELPKAFVRPLVEQLPHNVTVWKYR